MKKRKSALSRAKLQAFVDDCGCIELAAARAGVSGSTYWRWLHDRSEPHGNNVRRLRALGVL